MTEISYPGEELPVFAHATHWKTYLCALLHPFLRGDVLEVGAGMGSATLALYHAGVKSWSALEPDTRLAGELRETIASSVFREKVKPMQGALKDLAPDAQYDTILYFDVLEHIENDAAELTAALAHLRDGGQLIVVSPAQQWLYSDFDRAIGHYRRYSARTLQAAVPPGMELQCMRYLDSIGMFASFANRFFLKQANPTLKQILFWDRVLTRLSRVFDRFFAFRVGKNILGVWSKRAARGVSQNRAAGPRS